MDQETKLTPEEEAQLEEDMKKVLTMDFARRDLIVIFNVLVQQQYKYGDLKIVGPIIEKIEAQLAVDSNIQKEGKKLVV